MMGSNAVFAIANSTDPLGASGATATLAGMSPDAFKEATEVRRGST